ncbi:hypothetical protein FA15DRAFT_600138 [Coprinopsis marcescibilis]|uniref:Uncharacterized protein n=1 Tax=Coprinopsis marcescibilis TaxID=230819 RepID=A0A5C3KJT8_COPMA|nr:hypothetical protein FA15DRAFT_600138 [Coprinopsis marcescibilis]
MSADQAYGDYQLAKTRRRKFKYNATLCYAYSTRYNFRRLESLTHAIWNLASDDLMDDISPDYTIVVPQLTVTSSEATNNASADDSIETTSPKGMAYRTPDFTGVFLAPKLREMLDCPPTFEVLPLEDRLEDLTANDYDACIPAGYRKCAPSDLYSGIVNWNALKMRAFATLWHAELKRPPSRRYLYPSFFFSKLEYHLNVAIASSDEQARIIFESEPKTQTLISIAAIGEWWAFSLRTCDASNAFEVKDAAFLDHDCTPPSAPAVQLELIHDIPSDTLPIIPRHLERTASNVLAAHPNIPQTLAVPEPATGRRSPRLASSSSTQPIPPQHSERTPSNDLAARPNISHSLTVPDPATGRRSPRPASRPKKIRWLRNRNMDDQAQFVFKLRDALPEANAWSKIVLFGTPASNQRFYLIHELLKREAERLVEVYVENPELGKDAARAPSSN